VLPESFCDHFPIGGPIRSVGSYAYPTVADTLTVMHDVHRQSLTAIAGMSQALLAEPAFGKDGAPHPHYTDKLGAVTHCARHEAFHAGQLAMIRRLLGKPFLR
jgi:uncharacterized damage-inducible protein DinB